jgi:uncharacterized protein
MYKRRSLAAFAYSLPIGVLAGLVGVGGAEFRLPVLVGALGYSTRRAVPLNLAVSLATLGVGLATRSQTLALQPLVAFVPALFALTAGSVTSAVYGIRLARKLSDRKINLVVCALLAIVGAALVIGGVSGQQLPTTPPQGVYTQVVAGLCCGAAVGMVSSIAGVGGGQLMVPTIAAVLGADIKTAGTASLFINLPTVILLVARYAQGGAYSEGRVLRDTVLPMGGASCVGALCGGLLAGVAPVRALKAMLGVLLILSALSIFGRKREPNGHKGQGSGRRLPRPSPAPQQTGRTDPAARTTPSVLTIPATRANMAARFPRPIPQGDRPCRVATCSCPWRRCCAPWGWA